MAERRAASKTTRKIVTLRWSLSCFLFKGEEVVLEGKATLKSEGQITKNNSSRIAHFFMQVEES